MSNFFETSINLEVKTYDIDFAGVVSNIVYIKWIEDFRLAMLATHYPLQNQLEKDIAPAILQTKIDYKKSIRLFERVSGRIWISNIQKIKWFIQAEIYGQDKVAAVVEQSGIFVSLSRGRPVSIPDDLLQKYLEFKQVNQIIS
jgi:acyl-CoA thioester hydrolase